MIVNIRLVFLVLLLMPILVRPVSARAVVGGTQTCAGKHIVNSKGYATLAAAMQAAGVVEILNGPGPFTAFAAPPARPVDTPPGTIR